MTQHSYADLAAEMYAAADRLARLDAQGIKPLPRASLYLSFGYDVSAQAVAKYVPAVDAIAEAFGLTAKTEFTGRGVNRTGDHVANSGNNSALRINVRTSVPVPPTRARKLADLQRENEQLRAQLATQGGDR